VVLLFSEDIDADATMRLSDPIPISIVERMFAAQ
jgi:hypothetical protein